MAVSGIKLKTLPAITVATAGTAVPLSSYPIMVYEFILLSLSTNTGTQYIGDSTVVSSNGMPFIGSEDFELEPPAKGSDQFDLSKIYVNSTTSGAAFRLMAWVRE